MSRTRYLVSGYVIVCYIPCDNVLIVVLHERAVEGLYFLKYVLAMNLFKYSSDVDRGDWLVSSDIEELYKRST